MVTSKTAWTLAQALDLIRDLQPIVRELHYHITLGGGVLHEGASEKDLDLWLIPINGFESNAHEICRILIDHLGQCQALRDSPDYAPDAFPHAVEMQQFNYLGKRIDVFIQ